ncbi:MAG: cyclic dehypoxanthinyl futalosine synthase [Candidatus Krumholzibacteria bacterium]|nr:cyclic dehypoxanthinyl futalosine synthase [Candidatus Krumholzibacteria bacterium]
MAVGTVSSLLDAASRGERLKREEGLAILREVDLLDLGRAADQRRKMLHPESRVTFILDRNINYSNVCNVSCRFCAFYRREKDADAYVLSREELARKIEETLDVGGSQILMQGGVHPGLKIDWYEDMLRWIRENYGIHVHAFSPVEIRRIAEYSDLSIMEALKRLQAAGLDSVPGGGAEILADRVRREISPLKDSADEWLEVMETAHSIGMRTTATMMFGHVESDEEILEHLHRLREVQDRTRGFTAFIPWTFQPENTRLKAEKASAVDYLRVLALSRLYLDNFENLQLSYVTMGAKIGQVAMRFGANDFGSLMLEENVVSQAGASFLMSREEIVRLIRDAGFRPALRNQRYEILEELEEPEAQRVDSRARI